MALVPLQDPSAAVEEARRAVTELGLVGVTIPGLVGRDPLDLPKFRPFFEAVSALDTTLGLDGRANRERLIEAMHNHVLGEGILTGMYGRKK